MFNQVGMLLLHCKSMASLRVLLHLVQRLSGIDAPSVRFSEAHSRGSNMHMIVEIELSIC